MHKTLFSVVLVANALVAVDVLAPAILLAQQPNAQQTPPPPQQPQQGGPAAPKAYNSVPVQPPKPVADPSFVAFRKLLAGIAQKKDRRACAARCAELLLGS